MLYFIVCAALAAGSAYWLQPRLSSAKLLVVPLGMVAGLLLGTAVVFGALSATGAALVQSEIPRTVGQAFWWCLLSAGAGFWLARARVSSTTNTTAIFMAVAAVALVLIALTAGPATPPAARTTDATGAAPSDDFDPSRAVPLRTYQEMKKAGDEFNPARAVPLRN
ncbi:hypothetical protein LZ683_08920 [Comamonas testosteroni]|uniref:hypothetical protein n=1 Tax=Comamonas testosteroni TaxID=285 RepID=UPI0023AB4610|nr:hypothetical protein [Comamonas testosteroni]WEE79463.1 hypothetical protein LZ683_08920 [Comamonas testosteroni]